MVEKTIVEDVISRRVVLRSVLHDKYRLSTGEEEFMQTIVVYLLLWFIL